MDALNAAVNFVCTQEGFEANAYKDSAGIWTVGFGFTGKMHDDRDVKDVRNLSLDVAKQELAYRLTALLDELKALCGGKPMRGLKLRRHREAILFLS